MRGETETAPYFHLTKSNQVISYLANGAPAPRGVQVRDAWLRADDAFCVHGHCYCGQIMTLVWGVLPVWADISVATLHNARENSFLLGCAISRFFGVYTYVVNLYLFLTINLLPLNFPRFWDNRPRPKTNYRKVALSLTCVAMSPWTSISVSRPWE